jgi:hypothetical protein
MTKKLFDSRNSSLSMSAQLYLDAYFGASLLSHHIKKPRRPIKDISYRLGIGIITLTLPLIAKSSPIDDILKSAADQLIQKALPFQKEIKSNELSEKMSALPTANTNDSSDSVVRFVRFSAGASTLEEPAAYSKGSMQLRAGYGYNNNESNFLGGGDQWGASCDIFYVIRISLPTWAPKSHSNGDSQDQFCALNELLHAIRTAPPKSKIKNINLYDKFARRETIQEFSKVVESRKSEIKTWGNKAYFFLADGVDVSPYDFNRQAFTVSLPLPPFGWYQQIKFIGTNIRDNTYVTSIVVGETLARKIETARTARGFRSDRTRVDFTITAVREVQGVIQLETRIDSLTVPSNTGAEKFNWTIQSKGS